MTPDGRPYGSIFPRLFAGVGVVLGLNLASVGFFWLLPLAKGFGGLAVGFYQLLWVLPLAAWRAFSKDPAFASGALLAAAITLLLGLGSIAFYGIASTLGSGDFGM